MNEREFSDMLWGTAPHYMKHPNQPRQPDEGEAIAYVMGGRAFVANVIRCYIWSWSL